MSTLSSRPTPSSHVSWGVALAAGTLLLIGGGALIWSTQGAEPGPPALHAQEAPAGELFVHARTIPLPPTDGQVQMSNMSLHSVAFTMENGTRVVKIKVVETGDELVVDAATGRLLEARPSRPTAPPPAGRFAAPFAPLT